MQLIDKDHKNAANTITPDTKSEALTRHNTFNTLIAKYKKKTNTDAGTP